MAALPLRGGAERHAIGHPRAASGVDQGRAAFCHRAQRGAIGDQFG